MTILAPYWWFYNNHFIIAGPVNNRCHVNRGQCYSLYLFSYLFIYLLTNYVNSRRHVDSEKIRAPDGIWTHDPPWSSRMLYHWATGDSVVSKGQIVGIDWNRIARLHSHVLAHMNSLTASRCHINASHMNSLTASRRHIKAYQDASNQPPKWQITTTWNYVNSRRHVDSEKIRAPDGIWTHDPPWSSRMLYHWATGDSVVSKGQIVGIDWNRIARLHSHVLAGARIFSESTCLLEFT